MLFTSQEIKQQTISPWKKDAHYQFEAKMADKIRPFPCIPATQGHQLNHFRYGFLSNPLDALSTTEFAKILEMYSERSRDIGNYTSLIIFYEPLKNKTLTVEDYEHIFWEQLNRLTEMDSVDWPKHIPPDTDDPLWEFCFHGEQYFMYCATPVHLNRQSRYFPYLMLAITPRWALEEFNSSKSRVTKTKTNIRKRLAAYDSIPIHPDLNTYGKDDNYEWKQYFLRDDDTTIKKCPFHKFIEIKKTD